MPRTIERFWGHPDDWPDDEWQEYVASRRAEKPEPKAEYIPTTDHVRASYAANSWDYSHPEEDGEEGRSGAEAFDRWLARVRTDAYFRGAEALSDQNAEDHFDGSNRPEFDSLYEDGVTYVEWQKRKDS